MIFRGSRYERTPQAVHTEPGGASHVVLTLRTVPPTPATYRHVVTAADRLDLLAHEYYGRADRFWRLADANAALDPEALLVVGAGILVPPDSER